MTKNYKVTGTSAIFGANILLKLSDSQAQTRAAFLKKKKKDIYLVLEPIQFKQGEEITVISGNVSKSLLNNLLDLSPDSTTKEANNKPPSKDENKNKTKEKEKENQKDKDNPDNV